MLISMGILIKQPALPTLPLPGSWQGMFGSTEKFENHSFFLELLGPIFHPFQESFLFSSITLTPQMS